MIHTARVPLDRGTFDPARLVTRTRRNRQSTSHQARSLIEPLESRVLLAAPTDWVMHGPGGGGAYFGAAISPHNPDEIWTASDMTGVYRSDSFGESWQIQNFRQIQGGSLADVYFTSDPNVVYALSSNLGWGMRPAKSTDGGVTWSGLSGWTAGEANWMETDVESTDRLLVATSTNLYISTNGGASFSSRYNTTNLYVAGAFFDGQNIYVATNKGLLVSTDGGASFSMASAQLPAGQTFMSMAGAKQGGTTRLMATSTTSSTDAYSNPNTLTYAGFYVLDVGGTWVSRSAAITAVAAGETPKFVAMSRNDINIAYLGGADAAGRPQVLKTTDGGNTFSDVFFTRPNDGGGIPNRNNYTGWAGQGGDEDWSWGGSPWGFAISATDPDRVMLVNSGFVHVTSDGGVTWYQAYVDPADQNPPGAATPKNKAYKTAGADDTSIHYIVWADPDTIMVGYTDIVAWRSTDGGEKWARPLFDPGVAVNTLYKVELAPNGIMYGAFSTIHDLYRSTYLTDAQLDRPYEDGHIAYSTDNGASWSMLHDFGHPVIWTQIDPTNSDRMYAAVVVATSDPDYATHAGIWVTNNLSAGTSATWTKLSNPPRTEGRPYIIRVLNDGTLVVTYSGRPAGTPEVFTASSGVFVSTDGGQTWEDRSHPNMQWYTKDVIIDPTDPTQNTWYATVANGWSGTGNDLGDLYRTTDRGLTWTKMNLPAVVGRISLSTESMAINPVTGEMYLATDGEGLWYAPDARASTIEFEPILDYPFASVERVFINPFDPGEIWTATFGGGMLVGRTPGPPPPPGPFKIIITGADRNVGPHVKSFDAATGAQLASFWAYDQNFHGGVRVAQINDLNADGTADILVGPGPGHSPLVRIFNGVNGSLLDEFYAFDQGFMGGIYVATGDITGDDIDDIIVGADAGAGPHVKVFNGATGQEIRSFWAFDDKFQGGVRVAAGDVNGDGYDDIIVGAGSAAPHVKVFDGATGTLLQSFFAFDIGYRQGIFVAAGNVAGDGRAEIIVGTGVGPSHVKAFSVDSFTNPTTVASFFAYNANQYLGGVRVGAGDIDGDGIDEIITSAAYGFANTMIYKQLGNSVLRQFIAYGNYAGGVNVAASRT